MPADLIHVAVGIILDDAGRVLLTRRAAGTHLAGLWEFPGGKLEDGETLEAGLERELEEELGIGVTASRPLIRITHHYPEKSVLLDVHRISAFSGTPAGMEGQPLRWCAIDAIDTLELPAADVPIINALRLPRRYLITGKFDSVEGFTVRLQGALDDGIGLVQLRIKPDWLTAHRAVYDEILHAATGRCAAAGATLLLNVPAEVMPAGRLAGVHADSRSLHSLAARPDCAWFSASCHTVDDLARAQRLGADFAVLSPVQVTSSHPGAEPLGWKTFAAMVQTVNIPVYALGGVDAGDIEQAIHAGGQGVAGIGAFWR